MSSLLLLTVALGVLWVVWKAFFRFALKHPLDNIPGPPRESLIEGEREFAIFRPRREVMIALRVQDIWAVSCARTRAHTRTSFVTSTGLCARSMICLV